MLLSHKEEKIDLQYYIVFTEKKNPHISGPMCLFKGQLYTISIVKVNAWKCPERYK